VKSASMRNPENLAKVARLHMWWTWREGKKMWACS